MEDAVQQTLNTLGEFLPKLLAFLAIVVIGWFVATAIAKLVDKAIEKAGFDRVVEKSSIGNHIRKANYEPSDLLSKIVKYALLLFVAQLAFGVFGPNPVSDLIQAIISYLPRVFVAILILVIAGAIAGAVREIVDASIGGLSYGTMVANLAAALITAIGVFAALDQLQIAEDIVNGLFYAALAIIAGIAIVAVGGGGIQPMRNRWENVLAKYDEEKGDVGDELDNADKKIEQRAEQRQQQAQQEMDTSSAAGSTQHG